MYSDRFGNLTTNIPCGGRMRVRVKGHDDVLPWVETYSEAELGDYVTQLFGDASLRAEVGENGRRVVMQNRGALDRLLNLLPLP